MNDQQIHEKELCEKFGITEQQFSEFVRKDEAARKKVFEQVMSEDELADVNGGQLHRCKGLARIFRLCGLNGPDDDGSWDEVPLCPSNWHRKIDEGGFPNCAATVKSGSWCMSADACYQSAVIYFPMNNCSKAWD
jgi:hypothetical protein